MLTLERAEELLAQTTTQEHLFLHAKNVMAAMEGLAKHFGGDPEHWMAIGYLHDYDYEQHPEEHLMHTREPLLAAGLTEEEVRCNQIPMIIRFAHTGALLAIFVQKSVPLPPSIPEEDESRCMERSSGPVVGQHHLGCQCPGV